MSTPAGPVRHEIMFSMSDASKQRVDKLLLQCGHANLNLLLALVPDQVVGRVHRIDGVADYPAPIYGVLNSTGRALPDNAPLYARPADTLMRYVRAPSRKDPKYHQEWPEIEGGPVFDGVTYCNDLFEALKRYNVIVAETMPEGAVDE